MSLHELTFPLILSFLWGLVLYSIDGWIFVCCTKVYGGQVVGYAVSKQATAIAMVVFQIYQAFAPPPESLMTTMTTIIVLGALGLYVTLRYLKDHEIKPNEVKEQELQLIE